MVNEEYQFQSHVISLKMNKLSEKDLESLRHSAEVYMVNKIYDDFHFPFIVSFGKKHIFQEFSHGDIHIGILYLEWHKLENERRGYYKPTWFDTFEEVAEKAIEIQSNKIIDEEKLYRYHQSYFSDIYNPPERLYS